MIHGMQEARGSSPLAPLHFKTPISNTEPVVLTAKPFVAKWGRSRCWTPTGRWLLDSRRRKTGRPANGGPNVGLALYGDRAVRQEAVEDLIRRAARQQRRDGEL